MEQTKTSIFSSKTLDYFLQLAETMNYTKAAHILGISQPALTQQIKKIERSIDAPLFYSIGKKLYMTEAGQTMLRTTHSIYTILNNASNEIQKTTNSNQGDVKLGLLSSIEDKIFMQFIINYFKDNPGIKVTLYMLTRDEIWHKLENNKIDLAIMYLPDQKIINWKPYSSRKIIDEELLFLHHKEELADQETIMLSQTTNHPWAVYPDTYYINDLLRETFKNQLSDWPSISGFFTTPEQLYEFSEATKSFTALPKSFVRANRDKMSARALSFEPPIVFQLSFVYRHDKELIPRIKHFLEDFDHYLKEVDYSTRLKT